VAGDRGGGGGIQEVLLQEDRVGHRVGQERGKKIFFTYRWHEAVIS
jgi:hypothetical protein